MKKKVFGSTGEELSILGFGCMRLPLTDPNDAGSIDYDQAGDMLHMAIDRGVNYIDTAYPYHSRQGRDVGGESEPFVAHALKNGYRQKVKLATKLPTWIVTNAQEMHQMLDEQLKRLDTTHIDFYLAHNLNQNCWPQMEAAGMLDFFDEAQKDGRIKQAGFSFHDRYELFEEIIAAYDWSFTQIQYNYLDVDYQAGQRGLKLAAGKGLGVIIMEPLRGGFLVNHMPREMENLLLEARPDRSLADWGLRWLWNQPEVGVVLSGMSDMSQVDGNLITAETMSPMTASEEAALGKVREYFKARLKADCTGCGYCLPCAGGVDIPKNLCYYNDYFLSESEEIKKRTKYYFDAQVGSNETAAHCVHCQECEDKCPQHLPISDLMEKTAKIFTP